MPPRHLNEILSAISPLPRRVLVVTDGQNGAFMTAKKKKYFSPSLKAKRVNTTGAGDAFGSGFIAGLANGLDAEDALRIGMLNATGVISHMGAKAGILRHMPTRAMRNTVAVEILK